MQPPQDLHYAIDRAQNFMGKQNSDWQPFVHDFHIGGLELLMCLVPIGQFMMGGDSGYDNSFPIHKQVIDTPFWIAVHPITNQQWRYAVEHSQGAVNIPNDTSDYLNPAKSQHPVVNITWYQCQQFVEWLGTAWRLPTELQWEYSARGIESLAYPFGHEFQANHVIYESNSGKHSDQIGARPQGMSWVGAHDMAGNVWDWTNSLIQDYPYRHDDGQENIDTSGHRVLRGGSWLNIASETRTTCRNDYHPDKSHELIGFRLARPIT